ncbi:MAG TPA: M14 family metallopeptidase [Chloroflexota bacterium]|nr:M14 family metallopeptidase [Chloroflexota bacterium]
MGRRRLLVNLVGLLLLAGCTAVTTANHSIPTQAVVLMLATAVPPTPSPSHLLTPSPPLLLTPTPVQPHTAPLFNLDSSGQIIGASAEGRPMVVYRFGSGPQPVVFVGGMHGGYEWNTIMLAYEAIDYFTTHPEQIPPEVTLHIIPSANPDGQYQVTQQNGRFASTSVLSDTVLGRFNANGVDLNRNWDCDWSATAQWRDNEVSGGERPFSEPEAVVLRDYLLAAQPVVVVFWHSAANGVFAAGCPETDGRSLELAGVYGAAASYPIHERFNSYPITGDASDWLTTQGIPSFTVELKTHADTEWPQNRAGMLALLEEVSRRVIDN